MPDKKQINFEEKVNSYKLKTEPPLSEKDEEKPAEARIAKSAKTAENVAAELKKREK